MAATHAYVVRCTRSQFSLLYNTLAEMAAQSTSDTFVYIADFLQPSSSYSDDIEATIHQRFPLDALPCPPGLRSTRSNRTRTPRRQRPLSIYPRPGITVLGQWIAAAPMADQPTCTSACRMTLPSPVQSHQVPRLTVIITKLLMYGVYNHLAQAIHLWNVCNRLDV